MEHSMKTRGLALLYVVVLTGCATAPLRNFTGQENPRTFSTVITETTDYERPIFISKIDGRDTGPGSRRMPTVVDVRPGMRQIDVVARTAKNQGSYGANLNIQCEAGKMYRVILSSETNTPSPATIRATDADVDVEFQRLVAIDERIYTTVGELFLAWELVPSDADVPEWFRASDNRSDLARGIEEKIQDLPYSSANVILAGTTSYVGRIREISTSRVRDSSQFIFRAYETMSDRVLVSAPVIYTADPPPVSYYSPPIYIPPPPPRPTPVYTPTPKFNPPPSLYR
jgi:hypothetical protein